MALDQADSDSPEDAGAGSERPAAGEPGVAEAGEAGSADEEPRGGLLSDPWFRFAGTFGLLAVACEVLYYAVLVDSRPLEGYLRALAWAGSTLLNLLGSEATLSGTLVSSGGFAVQIAHGCDAIQVSALFACAVLSFPAPWPRRIGGLLAGIVWLQVLNQARIVSLVVIGRDFEDFFKSAHLTVWPSVLIVVTVISWVVWVRWATRDEPVGDPAA